MRPFYVIAALGITTLLLLFWGVVTRYQLGILPLGRSYAPRPKDDAGSCPWDFIKYEMSSFEQLWVEHSADSTFLSSPCKHYYEGDHERMAKSWYQFSSEFMDSPPSYLPDPEIFSKFTFNKTCTQELQTIWIEPIALALRNPLYCREYLANNPDPFAAVVDKSYMFVDWQMQQQVQDSSGRVYLFDMGASLFRSGFGGASQAWFVEQIEKRGLKLDGIWAWEYTVHDAKLVFADIPERLWPIYHWYNIPVSADSTMSNPWTVLQNTAVKRDFVIVKIDIDSPGIEQQLVQQLQDNPAIAELVDVLFYEDHINVTEMHRFFGVQNVNSYTNAVASFKKMRELGIRAHPWV